MSWLLTAVLLQTSCERGRQTENPAEPEETMGILIESDTQSIVFQLNDSSAAKSLYDQLPLTVTVENFGGNEKIFYPPEPLDVSDAPMAEGPAGTLAYYEPWGDVAIFYGTCGRARRPVCIGRSDFRCRADRSSCGGTPNRKSGNRTSRKRRRSRAPLPHRQVGNRKAERNRRKPQK